jgi:hypothetical protein
LIAGAINSAPLKSASFGTFLAETRKVRSACQKDKSQFIPGKMLKIAGCCGSMNAIQMRYF